jgi:hypothetical protein
MTTNIPAFSNRDSSIECLLENNLCQSDLNNQKKYIGYSKANRAAWEAICKLWVSVQEDTFNGRATFENAISSLERKKLLERIDFFEVGDDLFLLLIKVDREFQKKIDPTRFSFFERITHCFSSEKKIEEQRIRARLRVMHDIKKLDIEEFDARDVATKVVAYAPALAKYASYKLDYIKNSHRKDNFRELNLDQTASNSMLKIVQNNGLMLKNFGLRFDYRKVALAAVQQNGMALEFVIFKFMSDDWAKELYKAAIKQNNLAWNLVPASFKEQIQEEIKQEKRVELLAGFYAIMMQKANLKPSQNCS